eukprot:jgi/Botrbrau1/13432/Bobra.0082s0036.1
MSQNASDPYSRRELCTVPSWKPRCSQGFKASVTEERDFGVMSGLTGLGDCLFAYCMQICRYSRAVRHTVPPVWGPRRIVLVTDRVTIVTHHPEGPQAWPCLDMLPLLLGCNTAIGDLPWFVDEAAHVCVTLW